MSARPRIECSKCGEPADAQSAKCPRCSSRVIKVCGACGFKNSVAKKYCDSCGEPQAAPAPVPKEIQAPKTSAIRPTEARPTPEKTKEPQAPPETSSRNLDIPKTFILRPAPEGLTRAKSAPESSSPEEPHPAALFPKRPSGGAQPSARRAPAPLVLLACALLLGGAAVYAYFWNLERSPKALVGKTARVYLSALQHGDYRLAYSMLSSEARKSCPLEEFKSSQTPPPWSFGDIQTQSLEKDGALVRYTLSSVDHESSQDVLRFVRESGRWTRAYWWNLSPKIEEDPGKGLEMSQIAVHIDPYDPLARSYLCEAQYARGDMDAAERECRMTLELAEKYPGLDDEGARHTHAILGDIYKNRLARYADALIHFDFLLASPDIAPAQLCDLHLARAETRYWTKDYPGAASDFEEAAKLCLGPDQQALAQRGSRVLSGQAGPEAVAFAKNYRMTDGRTALEWGDAAAARLAGKAGYSPAAEEINGAASWTPEHLDGSLYKVSLRNKQYEILIAQVDLWNQKVKVDTHVQ